MTILLIIAIFTLLHKQLVLGDNISLAAPTDWKTYPHGNPFIPGMYGFLDAAYYGSNYWLFFSAFPEDKNNAQTVAYSSPDLKTWTGSVQVLSRSNFPWASGPIYAAATASRVGKYYLYFSTLVADSGKLSIGVGVADQPNGPYTDALNKSLLDTDNPNVDTTENMIEQDGSPVELVMNTEAGNDTWRYNQPGGMKIFRREEWFYLTFKHCGGLIVQAISSSLFGPFTVYNEVLTPDNNTSTGQATVVNNTNVNNTNNWFIVYSRKLQLSDGWSDTSLMGLAYERMRFTANTSTIREVQMTINDDFQDPAHDKIMWSEKGGPPIANTLGEGDGTSLMHNNMTNLTYQIDILGYQNTSAQSNAGFLFRAKYPSSSNGSANVTALEGYYAGITADNKVIIGKLSPTAWKPLNWAALPATASFTGWNTLSVVAQGPSLRVYINGGRVMNATDATYSWGTTGLRAYKTRAKFSNHWLASIFDS
ncbi:Glycosyl hydrolase, five-bladed beta-propellor domain containing protein [Rhypophila sp. PSN 637]